jgi:hypothetical protein
MNEARNRSGTNALKTVAGKRWLLLLHQIPAKPDYLRVKIWRRMQQIGAMTIKNAAWVLPATDEAMEDFQWLVREIDAEGGDALLCEARFLAGLPKNSRRLWLVQTCTAKPLPRRPASRLLSPSMSSFEAGPG